MGNNKDAKPGKSEEPQSQLAEARASNLPSPETIADGNSEKSEERPLPQAASDWLGAAFFGLLFIATMSALAYIMQGFLSDFVIAGILVGLVGRPYKALLPRVRHNAWIASGIITLLVLTMILAPLLGLAYQVGIESARLLSAAGRLSDQSHEIVDSLVVFLHGLGISIEPDTLLTYARDGLSGVQGMLLKTGGGILGGAIGLIVHLATILILVFYVLVDGARLRDFFFDLSPLPDDEDALLVGAFSKVAKGVVVGQILGSAIQGILGGLSFWFLDLPSAVLWGTMMGVLAFLPLVGVSAVAVPAAAYLYFSGQPLAAAGFLAFNIVQGAVVENVVKTRLIGSAMKMHDLLVFLTVLGGIGTFGLMGIVYGPLIATLFLTLFELYRQVYRPRIIGRLAEVGCKVPAK